MTKLFMQASVNFGKFLQTSEDGDTVFFGLVNGNRAVLRRDPIDRSRAKDMRRTWTLTIEGRAVPVPKQPRGRRPLPSPPDDYFERFGDPPRVFEPEPVITPEPAPKGRGPRG